MSNAFLNEQQILCTVISLGPCSAKHVLEEHGLPATEENMGKVEAVLRANGFRNFERLWAQS